MTDLQLGLMVLGAVAVVGVLLYNRIQERSVRRDSERAFASAHADVLLDGDAAETEGARPPAGGAQERQPPPSDALPDERVDYVMLLRIPVGVPGGAVLESWRPVQQRFGRRALLAGSDGSGWRRIGPGDFGSFTALRAALQLISRGGVTAEAELVEFRTEVETLASRVRAEVSAPEMRSTIDAAHELDKLCAEADIQVALHVIGDQLEPPAVEAALIDIAGHPFHSARRPDGLTLVLDVARTQDAGRAYQTMAQTALALAAALNGRVADDRSNTLDERSLAAIGAQLEAVRQQLAQAGIQTGSPLALRLFA
jgi:hypothetical protein